ncbi:MAG: FtsX-like permease family protein, partial [Thermoplasmata archaeon]
EKFYYPVMGVDKDLWALSHFKLSLWDTKKYKSEEDAKNAIFNDTEAVLVDKYIGEKVVTGRTGIYIAGPGENLTIIDPLTGRSVNKTVAGVINSYVFNGVILSKNITSEELNLTKPTFFLIKFKDGKDIGNLSKQLEASLLRYQLQATDIGAVVETIYEQTSGIFDLFNIFLGLGLIIGIASLGIISLKSVQERRQQIGVIRALGFSKGEVVGLFSAEIAFIALSGIVIGTLLGIIVGFNIWYDSLREMDYRFAIPWLKLLAIAAAALITTLICTTATSVKASSVSPAEALRYE